MILFFPLALQYNRKVDETGNHGGSYENIQKSEIIAIAYSAVVKQIVRLAKSNAESNTKLFAL